MTVPVGAAVSVLRSARTHALGWVPRHTAWLPTVALRCGCGVVGAVTRTGGVSALHDLLLLLSGGRLGIIWRC